VSELHAHPTHPAVAIAPYLCYYDFVASEIASFVWTSTASCVFDECDLRSAGVEVLAFVTYPSPTMELGYVSIV
jgi:hypothetical protein